MEWVRGDNRPLPQGSNQYGGNLYIDNVQPSDAGEYKCLGKTDGRILFSVNAKLEVLCKFFFYFLPNRRKISVLFCTEIFCFSDCFGNCFFSFYVSSRGRHMCTWRYCVFTGVNLKRRFFLDVFWFL